VVAGWPAIKPKLHIALRRVLRLPALSTVTLRNIANMPERYWRSLVQVSGVDACRGVECDPSAFTIASWSAVAEQEDETGVGPGTAALAETGSQIEVLQLVDRMPIKSLIAPGLPMLTILRFEPLNFHELRTIGEVTKAAAGILCKAHRMGRLDQFRGQVLSVFVNLFI
jgi:hypothetical protein